MIEIKTLKNTEDNMKDLKTFIGIPEIKIGNKATTESKGLHLFRPMQVELDEAKERALDRDFSSIYIYHDYTLHSSIGNGDNVMKELS